MTQIPPYCYSKSSLSRPQHTCVDPDKDVEVIQHPTTISPKFHSTRRKNDNKKIKRNSEPCEEIHLIKRHPDKY